MNGGNVLILTIFTVGLLNTAESMAQENSESYSSDGQLPYEIHGFIAQGAMQAADSNYVNDEGDVSFKLTEIGLNGVWRFKPGLTASGQITYLNADQRYEEGVRLDYLFLKWTAFTNLHWNVDFYGGRYKNNHWLHSATNDVPMTRPTIILPQSVYFDGSRDISVGSDGIAMQVNHFSHLGEFEFNWSYGSSPISDAQVKAFISDEAQGKGDQKFAHQMSLYWEPELSNFRWGLSYLDSEFEYEAAENEPLFDATLETSRYFGNFLYSGEYWEISSEVFLDKSKTSGLVAPDASGKNYGQGGYLQARYHFGNGWLATIRQDKFFRNKDDKSGKDLEEGSGGQIPSYFGFQHDFTVGVSYDFAPNWRVMAEYHWIEGTARTIPIFFPDVEINQSKYWDAWALEVMYWF